MVRDEPLHVRDGVLDRRRARRRRHRRRVAVIAVVSALVLAGAGSAWALRGGSRPMYRLATARNADVAQTVAASGSLAAHKSVAAAFAATGTVATVAVAVGDSVRAGQKLGTLSVTSLDAAVTAAQSQVARAKQQLADDKIAQQDAATTTATTASALTSGTTTEARFLSARTDTASSPAPTASSSIPTSTTSSSSPTSSTSSSSPTSSTSSSSPTSSNSSTPSTSPAPGASSGSQSASSELAALRAAQTAVVIAQHRLDTAIAAQDALVAGLVTVCRTSSDASTVVAGADSSGRVSGQVSGPAVVTLLAADGSRGVTSSQNPQTLTTNGSYAFAGLTAATSFTVQIVRTGTADPNACAERASAVASAQAQIDSAQSALAASLTALSAAIAAVHSSSSAPSGGTRPSSPTSGSGHGTGGTGTGSGQRSGSTNGRGSGSTSGQRSGSSSGSRGGTSSAQHSGSTSTGKTGTSGSSGKSGSGSSSGTTRTITAEQLAADQKSIDAAQAELLVSRTDRQYATLTAPISGTIANVDVVAGDSVSAGSTSQTITVVGSGTLSVEVSIGISDIDLVKAGERAAVTVDGHTAALPATVSYVGQVNSSSSTGSSAAYTVTVQLAHTYASLYDGMGADVAIDVGTAAHVLTVPLSALHTSGTRTTVQLASGSSVRSQQVTLGLVGDSLAQVKSGLRAGQRVVLATIGAAIPSSTTNNNRSNRSGLSGLSGGGTGGGGTGGGPGAGGSGGGPGGR